MGFLATLYTIVTSVDIKNTIYKVNDAMSWLIVVNGQKESKVKREPMFLIQKC